MSYMIPAGESQQSTALRRRIAEQMLMGDNKPVEHWAQGAGRIAEALVGGLQTRKLREEEAEKEKSAADALMGLPGLTPEPSPAVSRVSAAMTQQAGKPRGIRNNNPLNIEAGRFTEGQPGYSGSDGRFARFDSPDAGIGAANKLLDIYRDKHGLNTVSGIIGRWAPAGDGNNVSAYAGAVAKELGIDPNSPIPPEMRAKLVDAMGRFENGRPIRTASVNPAGTMTDAGTAAPPVGPQMAQAPSRGQSDAIDPQNAAYIRRLLANPQTRSYGMQLYNTFVAKQMTRQPTYGVISKDEFGKEQYGWIDPVNRTTSPATASVTTGPQPSAPVPAPQAASASPAGPAAPAAGAIPAPPPGADPKKWREEMTKNAADKASTEPQRKEQERTYGNVVVQDIDRALQRMTEGVLPTTGAAGKIVSNVGGTAAGDVAELMSSIKSNIGFERLNQMRQQSPTGGALGSVTEGELKLLHSTFGSLEQSQSEQQFRDNLKRVKNIYMDIIHGKGNGPREQLSFDTGKGGPAPGGGNPRPSGTTKAGVSWSVE